MSVAALLAELRERQVELTPEGDQIRYRAPRGALTPELKAQLKAYKRAVLVALTAPPVKGAANYTPPARSAEPAGEVLEERQAPIGWRFWCEALGDFWVARGPDFAEQLWAETKLPVFLVSEVPKLTSTPAELLQTVANTRAAFGPAGSSWVQ